MKTTLKETDFTMLPNKLFYAEDKSLFEECKDYKLLLVMDYLHINTNRLGVSIFSIEDIITFYGFKPKTGAGKMNEQIKNILEFLQFKGILQCDVDIKEVKINQLIRGIYTGIEKNSKGDNIKFTKVSYQAMDYILAYDETKIDNLKLLFYYSYICCRRRTREKSVNGDINCTGGYAEVAFPSYETIQEDTGFVDDTIKQYNDILVKLNLIKIGNCGLFYYRDDKNKNTKESINFYALVNGREDYELEYAMKLYKEKHTDMVFTNKREYKNNNKKMEGYINRVKQLEAEGKATEKHIKKRDSYLASVIRKDDTISSLKGKIKTIHKNIIELADKYHIKVDVYDEVDCYFYDEYDIDDLKELFTNLSHIKTELDNQINKNTNR